jgi:hypothetical protein
MKQELAVELSKKIMELSLHPAMYEEDLYIQIRRMMSQYDEHLISEITKLVKEWETEVPDDKSLYTLGLRRSIDIIGGVTPVMKGN